MIESLYNGMKLDIFDMYGITDIRSVETNRYAQIFCQAGIWELHLYWNEDGVIKEHYEVLHHKTKPEASTAGKDWVVEGRWLQREV